MSDSNIIAPQGWHIPTNEEWEYLVSYLGGETVAGGKMKTKGTIQGGDGLWWTPNTKAGNESGFSAVPGGSRSRSGYYGGLNYSASFWSRIEKDAYDAFNRHLDYDDSRVDADDSEKQVGLSIRCIKD